MKKSTQSKALNAFLKYGIKPFQAHIGVTPRSMKFIRYLTNKGAVLYSKVPGHVSVERVENETFEGEWLATAQADPDRVILYIHGGAFFLGSPLTHRPITWRLADNSGVRVLSLDYRLMPEHSIEDAVLDAVGAYQFLLDTGYCSENIVIGGDSAGGGLTLMTMLRLKAMSIPLPSAAFCISPFADYTGKSKSLSSRADSSILFHANIVKSMEAYIRKTLGSDNPLISPKRADYSGLPKLYIQVGDNELLLDDSMLIVDKYKALKQPVALDIWHQQPHVFALFAEFLPEGRKCIKNIAGFIRESFGLKT